MNDVSLPTLSLVDLAIGDSARVVEYAAGSADYAHQLTRLGLTPGTPLTLIRRAPLGDPIEIQVRGFSLALRPAEARCLRLERL